MTKLMLRHKLAMGDTVLFTALCRDIALTYPGKYEIVVDTHFREVFAHHPYARVREPKEPLRGPGFATTEISYRDGILAANSPTPQRVHMLSWYHRDFSRKTHLAVQPLYPKACIPLSDEEKQARIEGDYWLIVAGGKRDATVKVWRPERWQELVNRMNDHGIRCVQTGARHNGHFHPSLTNVVDMVGRCTTTRELFSLIYNANGVICPITGAMHVAAAYDKPCVVIAGGREAPWWEGYTNQYAAFGSKCPPIAVEHRYLHTLGQLACCKRSGCWKHRTVLLGNKDRFDRPDRLCKLPVVTAAGAAPKCMDLIGVEQVLEAVLSYRDQPAVVPQDPPLPPPIPTISLDTLPPPTPVAVVTAPVRPPPREAIDALNHPILGGKITVCVLCYGPHVELARKCLNSIFSTVPAEQLDVRVGCNAVEPATMDYLKTLPVTKIYDVPENPGKYRTMSRMFYDSSCPITTEYLCWLDDDVTLCANDWLKRSAEMVVANHNRGVRMYGNIFLHDILRGCRDRNRAVNWFHSATWWRGRNLLARGTLKEANNGSVIRFVSGWFWWLWTGVLKQCTIPDPRLEHNGDIAVAEQVRQMGWSIGQLNRNKELAWCPSKENGGRRGTINKAFPWQQ